MGDGLHGGDNDARAGEWPHQRLHRDRQRVLSDLRALPLSRQWPARPTVSTSGGALHITESGLATSAPQYVGVALNFAGCIDATAFTGVQFSISGSFSGCTMQYASGDSEHQDPATGAPYSTGPSGAYPPQSTLTTAQVTATPQTSMMPFTGNTMFGDPQTPLDTTKLILMLWQFTIPAAAPATADGGTPACVADITIDNVAFY
jgi:hypothetical protein